MEEYMAFVINLISDTFGSFILQDDNQVIDQLYALVTLIFSNMLNLPILLLSVFLLGTIFSHYQSRKIKFFYPSNSKLFSTLLSESKLAELKYKPYTFAFNGNTQSFLFPFIDFASTFLKNIEFERELFTLSDGGTIAIDWSIQDQNKKRPLAIIVPGLTGDSTKLYIKTLYYEAQKQNYDIVVINYRCLAGAPITSNKIFHAASHHDVIEAIDYISQVKKDTILVGIGISMGAAILANSMSIMKEKCPLITGVGIGAAFDSVKAMGRVKTYMYGVYDMIFGINMKQACQETISQIDQMNSKQYPERIVGQLKSLIGINQYTEAAIVKIANYKSSYHYLQDASCIQRLNDIQKPFFFLQAHDDPLMGDDLIPTDHLFQNVMIGVTKSGGHLCYFEGFIFPTGQWFPKPTFEYLNFFINQNTNYYI